MVVVKTDSPLQLLLNKKTQYLDLCYVGFTSVTFSPLFYW